MKLFNGVALLLTSVLFIASCNNSSGSGGDKFLGKWTGYVWKDDTVIISQLSGGLYLMRDIDPKIDADTLQYDDKSDELASNNVSKGYSAEIKYEADSNQIIIFGNGMRLGTMRRLK